MSPSGRLPTQMLKETTFMACRDVSAGEATGCLEGRPAARRTPFESGETGNREQPPPQSEDQRDATRSTTKPPKDERAEMIDDLEGGSNGRKQAQQGDARADDQPRQTTSRMMPRIIPCSMLMCRSLISEISRNDVKISADSSLNRAGTLRC